MKDFSDGLAAVKINDKWAYVNKSEELVIQPYYLKAESFQNGQAIVANSKYGLIDKKGEILIDLDYDTLYQKERYYLFKKDNKWGFANESGKILTYPNYDRIDIINGNMKTKKYGFYSLLNKEGVDVLSGRYSGIYYDRKNKVYLTYVDGSKRLVYLSDLKERTGN